MSEKNFEIETQAADGLALRVSLTFAQDRFVTEVLGVLDGRSVPLLRSVEGTSEDVWPSSGALQEVLPQEHSQGRLLAAVGRAGKSHWSVVVMGTEPAGTIEFDFACRVKDQPVWLGSTYAWDTAQTTLPKAADASTLAIPLPGSSAVLQCRALDSTQLDMEQGHLRFFSQNSESPLPRTVRWKYQFQLVDAK